MLANAKRVYMLAGYSIEVRPKGYYFAKSAYGRGKPEWRGPYSSESSVCLMIARALKKELNKRDAPYSLES
jgi:hypothetical protein